MMKLSLLLVVLFAMTAGEAFAFDRSNESSAQIYFAIPFGGATKAEAMPTEIEDCCVADRHYCAA